jgi:hypothetical protein
VQYSLNFFYLGIICLVTAWLGKLLTELSDFVVAVDSLLRRL